MTISIGQYTGNTVKSRYIFHTEYNLEIPFYALKWHVYCDIGNFTISTVTNNHDTLTKLESLLLKQIFSITP